MLRAFRFFEGFHGGDVREWLLQIVRNTCYMWLKKNRRMKATDQFDEELRMQSSATPESIAIAGNDRERLTRALETIPLRYREVIYPSRVGGMFLQGDRCDHVNSYRNCDVLVVVGPRQLHSALAKSAEGADTHEL